MGLGAEFLRFQTLMIRLSDVWPWGRTIGPRAIGRSGPPLRTTLHLLFETRTFDVASVWPWLFLMLLGMAVSRTVPIFVSLQRGGKMRPASEPADVGGSRRLGKIGRHRKPPARARLAFRSRCQAPRRGGLGAGRPLFRGRRREGLSSHLPGRRSFALTSRASEFGRPCGNWWGLFAASVPVARVGA